MEFKAKTELRREAKRGDQPSTTAIDHMSVEDVRRLVHELQVHQIELEMQNDELRRARSDLEVSRRKYAELYDHAPVGYCTLDKHGIIERINLTAAERLGEARASLLKERLYHYISEDDRDTFFAHLHRAFATGRHQTDEIRMLPVDGTLFYAQIESIAASPPEEEGFCRTTITDVSERKRVEKELKEALAEKEILMREIHHRTKNNMQVIRSMLSVQARRIANEELKSVFKEMEHRIMVMALVHEKLYKSRKWTEVDLQEYVHDVANLLLQGCRVVPCNVSLRLDLEPVPVSMDVAISCGLILNELITNALIHGFPENERGTIAIRVFRDDSGFVEICLGDDGVGVPENFDFRRQETLGLQLINSICEHQLGGEVSFAGGGGGVACRIRFKDGDLGEVPSGGEEASGRVSENDGEKSESTLTARLRAEDHGKDRRRKDRGTPRCQPPRRLPPRRSPPPC